MKAGRITALEILPEKPAKVRVTLLQPNKSTETYDVPYEEGATLTLGEEISIELKVTRVEQPIDPPEPGAAT